MKIIDARGLSCPEPVILLRQEMASGEHAYQILVDNHASKENTARYAEHQGYHIHCNVLLPLWRHPLQEAL